MKKTMILIAAAMTSLMSMGCSDNGTGWDPSMIPDDPEIVEPAADTIYKAPLYWSVYEYGRQAEVNGQNANMPKDTWQKNIDWVAENLLPYGFDMICTDGFMSMLGDDSAGHAYMTSYAGIQLTELVQMCKDKGLRLGIYDNPLWVHGSLDAPIEGTKYKVRQLLYEPSTDNVKNPDANGDIFTWIVPSHKGGQEYIEGFFKYYKNLGVDYIRMDFMCLFEDGIRGDDSNGGGRGYGSEEYKLALQYISEAAQKYGVFTSIVMPNMKNKGENEAQYGNMVRIVDDTTEGGWDHLSNRWRGTIQQDEWPSAHNQFDGFTYWSDITGRGKVIADGDFLLMHSLDSDEERKTSISLQLMAGGPLSVADQYNTIGDGNVRFYQNREMLALNADKFVGKPLSTDLTMQTNAAGVQVAKDPNSQIWYGRMSNGDYVVALFNRESVTQTRGVEFSTLGISGSMYVRDLWAAFDGDEPDKGLRTNISATLQPHACKVYRLSATEQ